MVSRSIILIGSMGTGKTTIGRISAQRLEWTFIDLDEELTRLGKLSITELFKQEGEEYFRLLESQVLAKFVNCHDQVIATGGGVILKSENRQLLQRSQKQGTIVVWLYAKPSIIWQRVRNNKARPLLNVSDPQRELERIMDQRQQLYSSIANFKIDTSYLTVNEAVTEIMGLVK